MIPRLSLVVAMWLAATGLAVADTILRIGVRDDAAPMAYRLSQGETAATNGPLGVGGYGGYVVHICDAAAVDLQRHYGRGMRFELVPLEAAAIYDALDDGRVDVFCGPTTATRARLDGRIASPPVFISGITFATRGGTAPQGPCLPVAGYVQGATARDDGIARIVDAGEWHTSSDRVRRALESPGTVDPAACAAGGTAGSALIAFPTHAALAEAFCAGEVRHYVGDYEIVAASLAARQLREPGCEYVISDKTFTEERYVILGNLRIGDTDVNATVALYFEALSRRILFEPSILDEAFAATFDNARPSRKLELLFWAMRGNVD